MTTVAIRVDAGSLIGLGHAVRCLALANALLARGATVRFVTSSMPAALAAAIERDGHMLAWLAEAEPEPGPVWPREMQQRDAEATLQAAGATEWIVVDHYRLDASWERAAAAGHGRVAVIEDAPGRMHDCDLLIDHNVAASAGGYAGFVPARCALLAGPRFALLRREFSTGEEPRPRDQLRRVLLAFGGSDPTNETLKALRALMAPPLSTLELDIMVGAANSRVEEIRSLAASRGRATVHVDVSDPARLMRAADLALGAGGVSALERCAVGLPALLVSVAENQVPVTTGLDELGAALYLGDAESVDEVRLGHAVNAVTALPKLVARMARRASEVCDGRGARRVADRLLGLGIVLRPARAGDRDAVLAWRNDPQTRRFSLDNRTIAPDAHARWFDARLIDPACDLLIGEDQRGAVGVLRYDVDGDAARVSLYLVPGRHGEGLGGCLLHAGHRWLSERRPQVRRVEAEVLGGNRPSALAFEEAGYRPARHVLQRELCDGDRQ